jgi:hypothetical protein
MIPEGVGIAHIPPAARRPTCAGSRPEASDRMYGKRLKVMIPTLLPALEEHGRLKLGKGDYDLVLAISAATINRVLANSALTASWQAPLLINASDYRDKSPGYFPGLSCA